ncbi:MAG: hypothetical protein AB2693_15945 [Candidatus Thiodiazotropha sp.]
MSGTKNKEKVGHTAVNGSSASTNSISQPTPIFPSANPFMSSAGVFNPPSIAQNPWMNDFSQKLEYIMSKMATLDTIVAKQNDVLLRLGQIESSLEKHSKDISDLKNTQNNNTQATNVNKQSIARVQGEFKKLADENKVLKTENSSLKEEVVDLQCRSMRENLLFMGIPEENSNYNQWTSRTASAQPSVQISQEADMDSTAENTDQTAQKSFAEAITVEENCKAKVFEFCKAVLKIPDPESKFDIDVAHRIGKRQVGKIRPIVAKFVRREHKDTIKQIAQKCNLRDSPFNVAEQLPKVVQERRKSLIPKMVQFRSEGKRATLTRDKLFVDGVEFKESAQ